MKVDSFAVNNCSWTRIKWRRRKKKLSADWELTRRTRAWLKRNSKKQTGTRDTTRIRHTHTHTLRTEKREIERKKPVPPLYVLFDLLNKWNGNDTIDSTTIECGFFSSLLYDHLSLSLTLSFSVSVCVSLSICLSVSVDRLRCVNYMA